MIKAGGTGSDGRNVVILGLSEGNIQKLKEGKPMLIDMEPLGGKGSVVIMYGATEADITRELAQRYKIPS